MPFVVLTDPTASRRRLLTSICDVTHTQSAGLNDPNPDQGVSVLNPEILRRLSLTPPPSEHLYVHRLRAEEVLDESVNLLGVEDPIVLWELKSFTTLCRACFWLGFTGFNVFIVAMLKGGRRS